MVDATLVECRAMVEGFVEEGDISAARELARTLYLAAYEDYQGSGSSMKAEAKGRLDYIGEIYDEVIWK
ncbi:MAG: hypothetical protein KKD18_01115 [Nanoarchaeota archaeon]|nr:hypothetical protein [Nanoarchaeota archaeon]MBU0976995.1 hypothetical protein [Nanoarchaeota archaeon]